MHTNKQFYPFPTESMPPEILKKFLSNPKNILMRIYFIIILFFYVLPSMAFHPDQLFVKKTTTIINPVTLDKIQEVGKDFVVDKPFLLNSKGGRYDSSKNEEPFYGPQKKDKKKLIYIGFEMLINGKKKVVAIPISDLTTAERKEQLSFPTPKVEKIWEEKAKKIIGACETYLQKTPLAKLSKSLQEIKNKISSDESKIIAKVREFHNQGCEKLRSSNQEETMSEAIERLKNEWEKFIEAQQGSKEKELAKKARELDLVARTITFETHPLGELDEKDPDDCANNSDCAISSCERDVLTLSIRNRAMACNKGQGCKFKGDFSGVATNPNGYSIWLPKWSHEFITSCFYRDGILSGKYVLPDGISNGKGELYRKRALGFSKTIESVAKVLFTENLQEIFSYSENNAFPKLGIESFLNYYHPAGMIGCSRDTYDRIYSIDESYVRRKTANGYEYDLLWGKKITLNNENDRERIETDSARDRKKRTVRNLKDLKKGAEKNTEHIKKENNEVAFKIQKWNSQKMRRQLYEEGKVENISYQFVPFSPSSTNKNEWLIPKDSFEKWHSKNKCLRMGLGVYQNEKNACSATQKPQYFTVPAWAVDSSVKRATIGCKSTNGSTLVRFGGDCDMRLQPISGVK